MIPAPRPAMTLAGVCARATDGAAVQVVAWRAVDAMATIHQGDASKRPVSNDSPLHEQLTTARR